MAHTRGRNSGRPKTIPSWAETAGAMREHGVTVKASCTADRAICDFDRDPVDLDLIIAAKGEAFSLWDRRPPCPICGAPLWLMYHHGVMRPLYTFGEQPSGMTPEFAALFMGTIRAQRS